MNETPNTRERPREETGRTPKCGCEQLVRKPKMFYWRGRYFHGLVCEKHNALYNDPSDSFMDFVSKR